MIPAEAFLKPIREAGFDFFTGVPCSYLTPILNQIINNDNYRYVAATSEGEAVAIAAGAWLSGKKTVFMCQNSGLGNAVNPLTSLNFPFRIPTLGIVTFRGDPGQKDEPQHEFMGRITLKLLDVIEVPYVMFPKNVEAVNISLVEAIAYMDKMELPYAFVMKKGDVVDDDFINETINPAATGTVEDYLDGSRVTRSEALREFLDVVPERAAVITSTGKCGRELFTLFDRDQHFYQVGSMGCASAIGLGVALNIDQHVVVLDGDGAALMKMGTLATIGTYHPENLIHVILDNGIYDSTGGQPTNSGSVDFAIAGSSCGYAYSYRCDGLGGFQRALISSIQMPGPHLIHMKIQPGSESNLGRPTIMPKDVARRFKAYLARNGS